MSNIVITTDSTCDLPKDILNEYNVQICPISILVGDNEYFDTVDIDANKVLEQVKLTGKLPKTSAISEERYTEFFKKYTDEGKQVIHFNISSKASCCHQNALNASQKLTGVKVVDSYTLTVGQGLLIIKAGQMVKEGLEIEEIYQNILKLIDKTQTSFVVDTLEFLQKGGRCSAVTLMASKMLKIHPSIQTEDGALKIKGKHMGSMQVCINKYLNELAKEFTNYDNSLCFVVHSPCDEAVVEKTIEKVKQVFNFEKVIEAEAGSTITSHCGYGTIGLVFLNK